MLKNAHAFPSFSVNNIEKAKKFYNETLGLDGKIDDEMGFLSLNLHDCEVMIYPKDNHEPATYTVLNFIVEDVEKTVDELTEKGITFEQYEDLKTDEKGISREWGQKIAWFKDPAGNIISVMEKS